MRNKCTWVSKRFALEYLGVTVEELNRLIENKKITYKKENGVNLLKTDIVAAKILIKYYERKLTEP